MSGVTHPVPGDRSGHHPTIPKDLLYRGLYEHGLVEVHIWEVVRDPEGEIVTWKLVDANPAALKSWGRELRDLVGRTTEEIFPGADATETFLPMIRRLMDTGDPEQWEVEFAGTDQMLHMVSFPVGDFFVSTGFDVSKLRRQRLELKEALGSLEQAVLAGGVGLWNWDLVTDEVSYSKEWKRQIGYAEDEIEDSFLEWHSRLHPDDLEATVQGVRHAIDHARPNYEAVFRFRHRDGSYRWILAQASLLFDDDGRPIRMIGSHNDITEQRRLEERVVESQRLESVGTLAAGIAHDFNNLLTAITGNLSLLREYPMEEDEREVVLRDVAEAAERAQGLSGQLLAFAKGGVPIREVAEIRDIVLEVPAFVARGSRSTCAFDVAEDLATVEADMGQISQVLDNLVINAIDAMPEGGEVRIRADNEILEGDNALGLAAGRYVRISVADDGPGIPKDELPRVFDLFYTTKAKGSGLGLASAYAIIAKHDGRLTVESEVGRGTTFEFHLPATTKAVTRAREVRLTSGTGRVLVLDDEAPIRALVCRILDRAGYTAVAVSTGDRAVERYSSAMDSDAPFDAVILDLTLPGQPGGEKVLERLLEVDPDVRAVVASGYSDADVVAHPEAHGFRGRLVKPMDAARLTSEVARVLAD